MFRRHPGGWNAARQAVFALIPVLMGAGVLVASGDASVTGMSRLEATQSSTAPLLERPPVAAEEVAPPTAEVVVGVASETEAAPAPTFPPLPGPVVDVAAAPIDGVVGAPAPEAAGGSAVLPGDESGSPAAARPPATTSPATTSPSTSSSTTTSTTTTVPAPVRAGRSRDAGAEAEVVPLTNRDRVAAGLGTLSRDACLDGVASGYAEQLARNGALAHNPGAGAAVPGCRPGATWGDNVGTSSPCDTALLEREWMASPSHRRNILTGAFTRIGVGAWTDENGACWVQVLFSS